MDLQTKLMAQIAVALDNMQAQLNYSRSLLVASIGGEPALYDDDGILTIGETSPTSGVVASFGGQIEVTDGSGGMLIATDAITITTSTTADVNVKLMTSGAELFMVQVVGGTSLTCLVLVQPTASGTAPDVYILGGHADFQTTSPSGYQLQISANTSNYLFFRAGPSYGPFTVKFISIKMGW